MPKAKDKPTKEPEAENLELGLDLAKMIPFDFERYSSLVEDSLELRALQEESTIDNAHALSLKIFDALHECGSGNGVGILLNSSTGKDSTLMVALYAINAQERRDAGKHLLPAIVGISDTGSEFPVMAKRMVEEAENINKFAEKSGLPLEARLVSPKPSGRLLPEIIGRGKFLPPYKDQANVQDKAAKWCMDRVKAKPLGEIASQAKTAFSRLCLQCVGVREDESAKRKDTIERKALNLPFGLTQLGEDASVTNVGVTPIVHWTTRQLRNWMDNHFAAWDLLSAEKLRSIYELGSTDSELAGECSLNITSEGAVSNVCSDLSGTRFGCWMCVLSRNKSLNNAARKDPSTYGPMADFHRYLFAHHKRSDRFREIKSSGEMRKDQLSPMAFLMEERVSMAIRLLAAEILSGSTLLQQEDRDAIEAGWKRHGIFTYSVADAEKDAWAWIDSGMRNAPEPFYHSLGFLEEASLSISGGLPFGSYHSLEGGEGNPPEVANLVTLWNSPNPLYPSLMAQVLKDKERGRHVMIVTDSPSTMGFRFNTFLASGVDWAAMEHVGTRRANGWEGSLARHAGRMFVYSYDDAEIPPLLKQFQKQPEAGMHPKLQAYLENQEHSSGCHGPDEHWRQMGVQPENDPKLSEEEFIELAVLSGKMAYMSDNLDDLFDSLAHRVRQAAQRKSEFLSTMRPMGKSADAGKFRSNLKASINESEEFQTSFEVYLRYSRLARQLADLIRKGKASPYLVSRLAYSARFRGIDEEEARRVAEEAYVTCAAPGANLPLKELLAASSM